ncbi:hypothetical protein Goklo_028995 [Gossypium klotzschianum]|uniref:DUF7745 domain-containing protein n=1 Tax=Gossypium klotzschianum TaxID=34286 RepID=A0A7J8W8Y2_9ROSI|nr:hypothetical protein [Gossypium klotzschianum]
MVRIWSENMQLEKGDSLTKDYVSELWDYTRISVTQNSLQELREIWDKWNDETRQLFYSNCGDLPYLFDVKVDKAYSRSAYVLKFWKKLMIITGMNEQWITARIKQKGECKCIPLKNLRDLIIAHPDGKKKVDVFALSIYRLVIFPRALGHVDEAVSGLFDRLSKGVMPVPTILAETFRSLNACRAPWLVPDEILYRCGSFDWVPLLGIWGAVGYAPLLVLRQYNSRQFVLATQGLAHCEFSYRGDNYKRRVKEISQAWNQVHRMKRLTVGPMTTQKLEKKIERLEEEKLHLRLDVDVQKLEAEKLKKGKNKVEEDLDSLKTDYKKLRVSMRTAGLGKTSEQWRLEIQEERNKADGWKKKCQETQDCEARIAFFEANEERQKEQLHYYQSQVRDRDHVMGEAVAHIREKLEQMQRDMQECLQAQMQERLDKIQEDIKAQKDAMAELTHLLRRGVDKGKGPMADHAEGSEDPLYPPGFTPPNART